MKNFSTFVIPFYVVLCKLKIHLRVLIWPVKMKGPVELWQKETKEGELQKKKDGQGKGHKMVKVLVN